MYMTIIGKAKGSIQRKVFLNIETYFSFIQ